MIVGCACVAGFVLLGVPSAVSLGVLTGVLELVPGIGPLTALLVACSQAGDHLLAVILFLVGVRLVQDYVVYPVLIRRGMHLSTLAVILTIRCGARCSLARPASFSPSRLLASSRSACATGGNTATSNASSTRRPSAPADGFAGGSPNSPVACLSRLGGHGGTIQLSSARTSCRRPPARFVSSDPPSAG